MTRHILEIENLSKTYYRGNSSINALIDIDLVLEKGSLSALTGPSGSGKSSLLNIIGTLDSPDKGNIRFEQQRVDYSDQKRLEELRRNYIGFIFQTFNLVPVLTAFENVELPLLSLSLNQAERTKKVNDVLEAVGLSDRTKHKPNELSGGQQQRVAVARALVNDPVLVLADEPTANLDTKTALSLLDLILKLNQDRETTFLFSTHDHRLTDKIPNRYVMQDGRMKNEVA